MHEEMYERDGVRVPVRYRQVASSSIQQEWHARITRTLDLLPSRRLRVFSARGEGRIDFKAIYRNDRPYTGGSFGYSGRVLGSGTVSRNFSA